MEPWGIPFVYTAHDLCYDNNNDNDNNNNYNDNDIYDDDDNVNDKSDLCQHQHYWLCKRNATLLQLLCIELRFINTTTKL